MKKKTDETNGFTLLEVLVAGFLLTVAFVSIATLFVTSMKVNASAGTQTECAALAQSQMEAMKDASYESLVKGGSTDSLLAGYHNQHDTNGDDKNDYVVSWSIDHVTATTSSPGAPLMTLKVKCQALRGSNAQVGGAQNIEFTTFKARGPK